MSTRTKKHNRSCWRYTKVLQQAFEVYPVYLWVIIAVSLHWRPRYGKNIRVISPCWHWNTNCTLVIMFCQKLNSNPQWTNTRRTLDSSCSLFLDSRTVNTKKNEFSARSVELCQSTYEKTLFDPGRVTNQELFCSPHYIQNEGFSFLCSINARTQIQLDKTDILVIGKQ